ncbi:uncharacterized protein DUF563 [Stella humosa]|uniref:Uncharacterized protein DUF563 n=1 Tax=Stella humosa TaxID=94 RepID=A0A3N1MET7_9PROT|nr:glycosyltransferase family 61 protein [Stella humosa]ROQ01819.1 uncharacterized protein DUF563 [Stella humosa]BBK32206.1 hypothetical protein STHU_28400 [Stella humosa]
MVPQFFPVTSDGRTFADAFGIYNPVKYAHLRGPEMARLIARRLPALAAMPDGPPQFILGGSHNYFHWLVDFLPRLAALAGRPELAAGGVVVAEPFAPGHRAALEHVARALRLGTLAVTPVAKGVIAIRRGVLPLRVDRAAAVGFWRTLIGPAATVEGGGRRLFLRRGDVQRRRFIGEAEVERMLTGYGFECLDPGQLSFAEQVRLFGQATAIFGTHGAAFTNLLFAPPTATVVELRVPAHLDVFAALARQAGQRYVAIAAEEIAESHADSIHRDIRLSPAGLETLRRIAAAL